MQTVLIEKRQDFKIKSVVSIEPYCDPENKNMGLEKYGMSAFDGGAQVEDIGYIQMGNKIIYLTGLDINAANIRNIEDPEEKAAKIAQIEEVVKYLEESCNLGKGTLNPDNQAFWKGITLTVENNRRLDLDMKDPQDIIKYYAIKAGGFTPVAPDYHTAKTSNTIYKWYLEELAETAAVKTEIKKERAGALGKLTEIFKKNQKTLTLVAKIVLTPDNQFKYNTSADIIYDKLYDFIQGDIVKTNKKLTPKQFMAAIELDKQTLFISALVKDGLFYKTLHRKQDGHYYNLETQAMLGKTEADIVEYLKNPLNQSELENLTARIEGKWNQ